MSRPRAYILLAGTLAVLALSAVGLVASKTAPAPAAKAPCLEHSDRLFDAPRSAGGRPVCIRFGAAPDRPLSLVDRDAKAYRWFGAAAVGVLMVVGLVVAPSLGRK